MIYLYTLMCMIFKCNYMVLTMHACSPHPPNSPGESRNRSLAGLPVVHDIRPLILSIWGDGSVTAPYSTIRNPERLEFLLTRVARQSEACISAAQQS